MTNHALFTVMSSYVVLAAVLLAGAMLGGMLSPAVANEYRSISRTPWNTPGSPVLVHRPYGPTIASPISGNRVGPSVSVTAVTGNGRRGYIELSVETYVGNELIYTQWAYRTATNYGGRLTQRFILPRVPGLGPDDPLVSYWIRASELDFDGVPFGAEAVTVVTNR